MKKLFLFLILFAPMSLFAQKFGHIDSQALLQSLPEAKIIQADLEVKGKQYDKQLPSCKQNYNERPKNMIVLKAQ